MPNLKKLVKKNILALAGLLIFFAAAIAVFLHFKKDYLIFTDAQALKEAMESLGYWKSRLVFTGMQILQVIIFFIPGEAVQVAGG
ncbi:MAG TPA: TVP38/TMEM64 family protein, partial [Spirochaetia bacterium]|nr:TVP38/TMEM64 family protein [Spirochaetia bacterium]